MKKYKLKKDLPRAKTGEVVVITNAHSNTSGIVKINKWNEDELQRPRLAYIHTKDVDEWLEEMNEKPKSVWDLKEGDDFYFIDNNRVRKTFITYHEVFKIYYLDEGNVFLTKEEAEKELQKRKAIQKIKRYCWENGIDTEYSNNNNIVFTISGRFICYNSSGKNGNPLGYFNSLNAQKIIANFEEELKIILE